MRRSIIWDRFTWVLMFTTGCWLFQGGCIGAVQRELEVLLAAEANGPLILQSYVFKVFGPSLIAFTNQWL